MEYIVLQNTFGAGEQFRTRGLQAREIAAGDQRVRAQPDVQRADFKNDSEVADALRDPKTVNIARNMPIKLIEPLAVSSIDDGRDAWGVVAVKADATTFTGSGVKVAVLDTGLMGSWQGHESFSGKDITEKNFTREANHDEHGHGTHCAGTIFGKDVKNRRIGVARDAIPVIGKVLGRSGGTTLDLLGAIQWAAQQEVDIISMSLGYDFPGMVKRNVDQGLPENLAASIALEAYRANLRAMDALLQMLEQMTGITRRSRPLVIAAAGNESARAKDGSMIRIAPALPSAAHGVLSVGALELNNRGELEIADFSNGVPWISAPGVDIPSVNSESGGITVMSGTSMACPHVAGVAALWWEWAAAKFPGNAEIADIVKGELLKQASKKGLVAAKEAGAGLVQTPTSP